MKWITKHEINLYFFYKLFKKIVYLLTSKRSSYIRVGYEGKAYVAIVNECVELKKMLFIEVYCIYVYNITIVIE
jgi:hypothetical protein